MTAMLPAHLSETLNNLGDAARVLADEVRQDKEQRAIYDRAAAAAQSRHNARVLTLLIIVSFLIAGLVFLSLANRRLGVANSALNRQNSDVVDEIRSCTTAGGTCYQQSQKRTAEIARMIILGGVYAQLCLRDDPDATDDQVERCVLDRAQAHAERNEPAPSGLDPSGQPIPAPSPRPAPSATS